MIRFADMDDLLIIKKIANQNREFIGFIMKASLIQAIDNNSLLVICEENEVVGFVHFHKRKDGWNTLHEIAISKKHQHKGYGQQLFETVPMPIRLKTTIDNVTAIKFYEKNGMKNVRTEQGRKRELLVFEKTY